MKYSYYILIATFFLSLSTTYTANIKETLSESDKNLLTELINRNDKIMLFLAGGNVGSRVFDLSTLITTDDGTDTLREAIIKKIIAGQDFIKGTIIREDSTKGTIKEEYFFSFRPALNMLRAGKDPFGNQNEDTTSGLMFENFENAYNSPPVAPTVQVFAPYPGMPGGMIPGYHCVSGMLPSTMPDLLIPQTVGIQNWLQQQQQQRLADLTALNEQLTNQIRVTIAAEVQAELARQQQQAAAEVQAELARQQQQAAATQQTQQSPSIQVPDTIIKALDAVLGTASTEQTAEQAEQQEEAQKRQQAETARIAAEQARLEQLRQQAEAQKRQQAETARIAAEQARQPELRQQQQAEAQRRQEAETARIAAEQARQAPIVKPHTHPDFWSIFNSADGDKQLLNAALDIAKSLEYKVGISLCLDALNKKVPTDCVPSLNKAKGLHRKKLLEIIARYSPYLSNKKKAIEELLDTDPNNPIALEEQALMFVRDEYPERIFTESKQLEMARLVAENGLGNPADKQNADSIRNSIQNKKIKEQPKTDSQKTLDELKFQKNIGHNNQKPQPQPQQKPQPQSQQQPPPQTPTKPKRTILSLGANVLSTEEIQARCEEAANKLIAIYTSGRNPKEEQVNAARGTTNPKAIAFIERFDIRNNTNNFGDDGYLKPEIVAKLQKQLELLSGQAREITLDTLIGLVKKDEELNEFYRKQCRENPERALRETRSALAQKEPDSALMWIKFFEKYGAESDDETKKEAAKLWIQLAEIFTKQTYSKTDPVEIKECFEKAMQAFGRFSKEHHPDLTLDPEIARLANEAQARTAAAWHAFKATQANGQTVAGIGQPETLPAEPNKDSDAILKAAETVLAKAKTMAARGEYLKALLFCLGKDTEQTRIDLATLVLNKDNEAIKGLADLYCFTFDLLNKLSDEPKNVRDIIENSPERLKQQAKNVVAPAVSAGYYDLLVYIVDASPYSKEDTAELLKQGLQQSYFSSKPRASRAARELLKLIKENPDFDPCGVATALCVKTLTGNPLDPKTALLLENIEGKEPTNQGQILLISLKNPLFLHLAKQPDASENILQRAVTCFGSDVAGALKWGEGLSPSQQKIWHNIVFEQIKELLNSCRKREPHVLMQCHHALQMIATENSTQLALLKAQLNRKVQACKKDGLPYNFPLRELFTTAFPKTLTKADIAYAEIKQNPIPSTSEKEQLAAEVTKCTQAFELNVASKKAQQALADAENALELYEAEQRRSILNNFLEKYPGYEPALFDLAKIDIDSTERRDTAYSILNQLRESKNRWVADAAHEFLRTYWYAILSNQKFSADQRKQAADRMKELLAGKEDLWIETELMRLGYQEGNVEEARATQLQRQIKNPTDAHFLYEIATKEQDPEKAAQLMMKALAASQPESQIRKEIIKGLVSILANTNPALAAECIKQFLLEYPDLARFTLTTALMQNQDKLLKPVAEILPLLPPCIQKECHAVLLPKMNSWIDVVSQRPYTDAMEATGTLNDLTRKLGIGTQNDPIDVRFECLQKLYLESLQQDEQAMAACMKGLNTGTYQKQLESLQKILARNPTEVQKQRLLEANKAKLPSLELLAATVEKNLENITPEKLETVYAILQFLNSFKEMKDLSEITTQILSKTIERSKIAAALPLHEFEVLCNSKNPLIVAAAHANARKVMRDTARTDAHGTKENVRGYLMQLTQRIATIDKLLGENSSNRDDLQRLRDCIAQFIRDITKKEEAETIAPNETAQKFEPLFGPLLGALEQSGLNRKAVKAIQKKCNEIFTKEPENREDAWNDAFEELAVHYTSETQKRLKPLLELLLRYRLEEKGSSAQDALTETINFINDSLGNNAISFALALDATHTLADKAVNDADKAALRSLITYMQTLCASMNNGPEKEAATKSLEGLQMHQEFDALGVLEKALASFGEQSTSDNLSLVPKYS